MQEKNSPEGLVGVQRRFVKFGGGLSSEQLDWMRQELKQAAGQAQRALVFCHLPMHRDSSPPAALLWNYPAAMAIIRDSGCVPAVFAGHAHQVRPIPLLPAQFALPPHLPDPDCLLCKQSKPVHANAAFCNGMICGICRYLFDHSCSRNIGFSPQGRACVTTCMAGIE